MLNASLRRSGGSYIMTIPLSYVEQNHLVAGSRLAIDPGKDDDPGFRVKPEEQARTSKNKQEQARTSKNTQEER